MFFRLPAPALLLLAACSGESTPTAAQKPDKFWAMVARLEKAAPTFEDSYESAKAFYSKEKPDDLKAFWIELQTQLSRSYRWDIWAVGAIVDGHIDIGFCSDYQIRLVLQGKDFYEAVLNDPTHACKRLPPTDPSSNFNYLFFQTAASNVYRDRTGKTLPSLDPPKGQLPSGSRWSWRDLKKMHPDLWETYFTRRDRRPKWPDLSRFNNEEELFRYAVSLLRNWVDIYHDPEYLQEQYRLLTPPQRGLHAVSWMKDESDNGGIDQFFRNSTGVVAPEALEGLKLFGVKDEYDELAAIMKAFPDGAPDRNKEKRRAQMTQRWGEKRIDEEFKGRPRDVELEVDLARYIRAHMTEFFRPK
jgi:hypothetical protein